MKTITLPSALRFLAVGLLALFVAGATTGTAEAQTRSNQLPRASPNATVSQTIGVTEVTVQYGRPSVNDRTIYGDLVSYGEVWRTGANEATTISFSTPVQIEGTSVDAGTYALFTTPGESTWKIHLNSEAEQWGAYNRDASKNVMTVEVSPQDASSQEQMTFTFEDVTNDSATLVLHWAETRVPVSLEVNTMEILREQGMQASQNPENWQEPARYASYALQNDAMLEDALSWAEASVGVEKGFSNMNLLARLQAKNGQMNEAVSTAEEALAMAEEMDEMPRGAEDLRSTLEEWKSSM